MTVTKTQNGNAVTVSVEGIIDTVTSAELNKVLTSLDYSDLDLTLDFSKTDYITSAGLRVLLIARKKLSDQSMRITGVNYDIAEVFKTTGFDSMLNYSLKDENTEFLSLSFKSLLKRYAEQSPEKVAFVYKDKEYTFADIEKASQIIAKDLADSGVKKGSHVGICAPNSINWVFTFYAVQKLGAVAVLLNYGLKTPEIASLSQIGDITHLCYGETDGASDFDTLKNALFDIGAKYDLVYNIGFDVDFKSRFFEYDGISSLFSETYHADDASVIIFTSGSTGKPKAVVLSSYNLISSMLPLSAEFKITEKDRNCAFLPFFHVFGFSTAVVIGLLKGTVSYIPENTKPKTVLKIIEKNGITLFHSVPTMMLAITALPEFSSKNVGALRVSALGGAAITTTQMEYLMKMFPTNHFSNVYGMSENAAISITGYGDSAEHITSTVGKPLSHVEVEIRDVNTGKRAEDGESGEIYVRSGTMIVCYYKMDIDKQPLDFDGWLATGDLGVICEDGYLKLVGRAKDLIIRGGENISPREVADAVAQYPAVADVKVVGVPDELYGETVAAAVILKEGTSINEDEIKAYLKNKLAKFKIPEHFVVMQKFPLLGSGKIDDKEIKKEVIKNLT